jgi:molecular chaperone DnaK (HSP70)
MSDIIIGIDLGTTNSEVSIVENGKVTVISDQGKKMLPSFVGLDDNDQLIVGETARNQYLVYPEKTVKSIKRLMGQDTHVMLGNTAYRPQEISAILLKQLKIIAENHVGQPVSKAVITVPAYFSDTQRQATREAGEIAGLDVVRMINEPTAAALTYDTKNAEAQRILVYDLGGGTFDVSVVNIESSVVEVLSSHGNNQLGGDDFDEKIIDYLVDHLQKEHAIDICTDNKAMARLTRAAENAKFQLSEQPYAQIDEEYLAEHNGTPIHLSLELSRVTYEAMIEGFIDSTLDAVHIALKDAQCTRSDIDEIILVGGSTRTPCVRERLANTLGLAPHGEVDADLCVAMGAAIQGAIISGQKVNTTLVDVTPYTYGTSAMGHLNGQTYPFMFVPIIHKNTVLPNQKTEAFATHHDGQEKVDITIYQGEDPDALNNVKIGEFVVEGLQHVEEGNIIIVTLGLDLDGILQVSAMEKETGLEKSITIKDALSQFEGGSLDTAKQRLNSLFGQMESSIIEHKPDQDEAKEDIPEIISAHQLISKAEALCDHVSAEDKEDMTELIQTLNRLIKSKDIGGLDAPMAELTDIIYYLDS